METHELWRKIEEAKARGQEETKVEDNGAEITIHMENAIWYPEYYQREKMNKDYWTEEEYEGFIDNETQKQ